jgi:hypothetical protein
MLIIFFDIKWIVPKEFILAGQTVNSAYYCDISWQLHENVLRLQPERWRQKNWLLHHNNAPSHTYFFTMEFFTQNNMTAVHLPPCFSLFPQLKIKLKSRHFDTIEEIEAELQDVLNTFREYDYPDAFKKMAEALGAVHMWRRLL